MKKILSIILAILTVFSITSVAAVSVSAAGPVQVSYQAHCQDYGWFGTVKNGAVAGTTGQAKRMEAIKITIFGESGGISYSTHVSDIGWMGAVSNGRTAGTTGQSKQIEAIKIWLTGTIATKYDVQYRVHMADIGWGAWVKNGAVAGTTGQSRRIEAIQISLVKKPTSSTPAASSWQLPMKNAYCTWKTKTDMSWSGYNYSSSRASRPDHLGIDIYGTSGKVYAAANGKVVAASSSNSGANGRYVIIEHTLNGKKVYSFYAHLSSVLVSTNTPVTKNTQIGVAGGSGYGKNNAYGTHLHFAIVDTLWSKGNYYGYANSFTGNKMTYQGVTYYNPVYVINNNRLP